MSFDDLGTFFSKEAGKTYTVNEGNWTVAEGISTVTAKTEKYGSFANPVSPQNFLEYDLGSGKELQVKPATAGSTARYINQYKPELPAGAIPTVSNTDAGYKRAVTAFRLPHGEIALPLKASNVAITAGDKLHIDSYNTGLDKETASPSVSKCTALETKAANAGGYILVELEDGTIPVKSA